ncbi:hypothetical protein [Streptomyces noursei]
MPVHGPRTCQIINNRGKQEEWLRKDAAAWAAKRAAEAEKHASWGLLGDILGIVSAVAGALAMFPLLTPLAGPVAAVTALAALGTHTVDAVIKGDWDAGTFAGLGADALAAIPGIGAVAKSVQAGATAMRAADSVLVSTKTAGQTFLAVTGGAAAADASLVAEYLGKTGAKLVGATVQQGKAAGKLLQGSVNLSTQVPLVLELFGTTVDQSAKDSATGTALTANYGQSVGSWGVVGTAAKKGTIVTIARFGRFLKA